MPELRIFVKKEKGEIRGKCRACGHIGKIDDKHKFSNHIKNFPPVYDVNSEMTPVPGGPSQSSEEGPANKVIDKETKTKMRQAMEKITKIFEYTTEIEALKLNVDKVFDEFKFDTDIKFFVLINGIFDKNIYSQLKSKIPIIKYVRDIKIKIGNYERRRRENR